MISISQKWNSQIPIADDMTIDCTHTVTCFDSQFWFLLMLTPWAIVECTLPVCVIGYYKKKKKKIAVFSWVTFNEDKNK